MKKWTRIFTQIALSFLVTFSYLSTDLVTVNASENLQNTVSPETSTENQDTFHIVYDGNGSSIISLPDTESYTIGYIPKVTESIPERTGYVFQEWNTEPDGTGDVYFAKDSLNTIQDMTLYAQWKDQSLIPADGTLYNHVIKTKYTDFLITAEGLLPEGASIRIDNIVSDTSLESVISNQISSDLKPVIYFNQNISLIYNNESYSAEEPIRITITGPIVRGKITGQLSMFKGLTVNELAQDFKSSINEKQVDFTTTQSCIIVIVDLTDQIHVYPVSESSIENIDKNLIDTSEDSSYTNYNLLQSNQINNLYSSDLPNAYQTVNLPNIRNQGKYGDCWAYAASALAECSAIKNAGTNGQQLKSTIDLSELQLAYFAYHQTGYDPLGLTTGDIVYYNQTTTDFLRFGGDYPFAENALMNWNGSVNESDVPNSIATTVLSKGLDQSYQYSKDIYHLENTYEIDISSADGKAEAKQLIKDNGAIGIGFYAEINERSLYLNTTNSAYYCYATHGADHAVTIVGWDDNYSKDNFYNINNSVDANKVPANDGAWLVRNSWGGNSDISSKEYEGYFWLSYDDKNISDIAYSMQVSTADNYDNNYHYDGTTSPMTYTNGNYSYSVGNVFTANANKNNQEELKAVSLGIDSDNVNYTLLIYKNLTDTSNPISGTLVSSQSGNFNYSGQYTIPLSNSVILNQNEKYSVVFKLSTSDYSPLYVKAESNYTYGDENGNQLIFQPSASTGQGFISANGRSWTDFTTKSVVYNGDSYAMKNLRIKAFTNNLNTQTVTTVPTVEPTVVPAATVAPTAEPVQTPVVETRDMYRLYNPNSGEHFYTANTDERDYLSSIGWNYEGVGWTAPKTSDTPVYRMYNDNAGEHHYTTSEEERDTLVSAGWIYEGIGWYSGGSVPLYREYNPNAYACNHNYTTSKTENDWLVSLGWNYEGISWYGM